MDNKFKFKIEDFKLTEKDVPFKKRRETDMLSVNIEELPDFESLNAHQKFGARLAEKSIQVAIGLGYLDSSKISNILDFGAGGGGPTFALKALGKAMNSNVEAVESSPKSVEQIVDSGILPKDQAYTTEGIEYLESNPDKYDLITAFFLGPDSEGVLFRKLAKASGIALSNNGNLLITSDAGTFSVVKKIVEQSGAPFKMVHGVGENNETIVPDTLIIPKDSCLKIE